MTAPFERRRPRQTRLPIRVRAVTEPIGSAGRPWHGEVQNLSAGGLLLRTDDALTPGATVRVTLRLRHQSPLVMVGTVAWTQPHPDLTGWATGIKLGEALPEELVGDIADAEFPPWRARLPA